MFRSALWALCSLNLASAIVQSPVKGPLKGFNYNPDDDIATLLPLLKDELPKLGASGFTSARLYTALADPDSDEPKPHAAFKAAGDTNTSVLIGLAVSLGDAAFKKELSALTTVLKDKDGKYGKLVSRNLIVGISVGNEDLYRQSIQGTPAASKQGDGSTPAVIMGQINQIRQKLKEQSPSLIDKIPVGHTDTWQMWKDASYGKLLLVANSTAKFQPVDFVGMQEFLYWEGYDVHNYTAYKTEALAVTKEAAGDIPVWATETGWPVEGPKCCDKDTSAAGKPGLLAWPGKDEAQLYWNGVGCQTLFAGTGSDARNTWWFRVYASAGKSQKADKPFDWTVIDAVNGTGATSAFPLDCKAEVPSMPTPSATSSGIVTAVSRWGVLPLMFAGWMLW